MTTENEKAVREAFDKWWRKQNGDWPSWPSPRLMAQRAWEDAWQAALQSQVSNTDGWVMVPAEPTPEMLRVAHFEQAEKPFVNNSDRADRVYRAMLSAAPKAPQQVSNTPQEQALGYIDRVQLERWEKLRGSQYASKEIGYIGFSREPFQTELTDCTLAVYTTLPPQQEQSEGAVKAFGYAVADAINEEHALGCGYLSSAQMHAIVEKVWEEEK